MIRIVAWCTRFVNKCRKKYNSSSYLTAKELELSRVLLVKLAQREAFDSEIMELEKTGTCKNGKLLKLNPFLDDNGILRVGGRIQLLECQYDKKHPAGLTGDHHFTKLLFSEQHLNLCNKLVSKPGLVVMHISMAHKRSLSFFSIEDAIVNEQCSTVTMFSKLTIPIFSNDTVPLNKANTSLKVCLQETSPRTLNPLKSKFELRFGSSRFEVK
nr:unnamed protein product [Callosobruchus analis]